MSNRGRGGSRRSTRSRVVEFTLAIGAVAVIYWLLSNGGPAAFGDWFARLMGAG